MPTSMTLYNCKENEDKSKELFRQGIEWLWLVMIGFEKKRKRMEWKRGAVNWKSIAQQTEGDEWNCLVKEML